MTELINPTSAASLTIDLSEASVASEHYFSVADGISGSTGQWHGDAAGGMLNRCMLCVVVCRGDLGIFVGVAAGNVPSSGGSFSVTDAKASARSAAMLKVRHAVTLAQVATPVDSDGRLL